MPAPNDDLEAVRKIVEALQGIPAPDQERVIRWSREKLGLIAVPPAGQSPQQAAPPQGAAVEPLTPASPKPQTDIRAFIEAKKPKGDAQFVATVAYYYRFEAPEDQRKTEITAADIIEACRLAGRERIMHPPQTLVNTRNLGLLDKGTARGAYVINTVGENLVAMTLPSEAGTRSQGRKQPRKGRKTRPATKKPAATKKKNA